MVRPIVDVDCAYPYYTAGRCVVPCRCDMGSVRAYPSFIHSPTQRRHARRTEIIVLDHLAIQCRDVGAS